MYQTFSLTVRMFTLIHTCNQPYLPLYPTAKYLRTLDFRTYYQYCVVCTLRHNVVDCIGRRYMQWFSRGVHGGLRDHPVAWVRYVWVFRQRSLSVAHNGTFRKSEYNINVSIFLQQTPAGFAKCFRCFSRCVSGHCFMCKCEWCVDIWSQQASTA